ncbi:MAG TPA: sugar phosphate isomerase/epimerase family protein [Oscillospiraceae bacterium]|nr:sugar phosphate isomerase/epimerase family protein [Oscillospiraceae bacterium]HPF56457.1 sugar phosphate isomerase/epimerase family protein [Clostridiales bacterium]HPK34763.1 sugar phosphate isomerase/epimerase family protein [Oscillospiraceae bacterium]HPR76137.1 sugar phosphate isomerase/epimerase family protein [Oscillospiraceae bacterium]
MLKFGLITDEVSQDLEVAAQLAAKYGVKGLELRTVWERAPHKLTDRDIKNIKEICKQYGTVVCGLGSPCFKCDLENPVQIEEHIEIFKKSAAAAAEFGVKNIRSFTFWAKNGTFEENFDKVAEKLAMLAELAKTLGVTAVVEQDPSVWGSNGAKVAKFIKAVNSPDLRALWDIGNSVWDPEGEIPYEGMLAVRPYIAHVHIKDGRKKENAIEAVRVGDGIARVRDQLKYLNNTGYDGWAVLETHYRHKKELDEQTLKTPGGSAFSADGYAPTEECLLALGGMEIA